MTERLRAVAQSDTAFVEAAFLEILGRPVDQDGLNHYVSALKSGLGRTAVLLDIMRSEEFRSHLRPLENPALPNLVAMRPEQYRRAIDGTNGQSILTFNAAEPADFDWLESAILDHGYYELPGVWQLHVDFDKRVVAEMIVSLGATRVLELGCAAGAILECLERAGVHAEGVEISAMAIANAAQSVRPRIHHGDLLSLTLAQHYDLVVGLDVYEHLNPNRLGRYIDRILAVTVDNGLAFCNIPAFGTDAEFGTPFPLYLDAWNGARQPFQLLHTDDFGYPIHGHLIWAGADWWAEQFETRGLTREREIERALHQKYDGYIERRSPARKAFFVFSKRLDPSRRAHVIDTITHTPSTLIHGQAGTRHDPGM
jgi:hypothetical protein